MKTESVTYILRSAEGDKFFMIATDLSIYYRGGWGNASATTTGSRDLIVWESTDLVNWSEPRAVAVGPLDAGCAWAPEAIYNEKDRRVCGLLCHSACN